MKLLIAGGAEFIDLAIICHINHSIVDVDKLTYASNLDSLESIGNNKYAFEQANICSINENERTFNIID